jgi:RNA polymerase sigma-70 factor (ECF subfamily)
MKDKPSLLKAAKKPDQAILAGIFDTYAPAIYRYSLRLCHDPIESDNIVGDVFAQLLEKLAVGQDPLTNLRSYIYQIAYHLIVDHARHRHRFTTLNAVTNSQSKEVNPSIQFEAEDHILMETLLSFLHNEVSDIPRHMIILRFLEGFSLREKAAITGTNVNNIKAIQNREIAKLRKCLGFQVQNDRQELSS